MVEIYLDMRGQNQVFKGMNILASGGYDYLNYSNECYELRQKCFSLSLKLDFLQLVASWLI